MQLAVGAQRVPLHPDYAAIGAMHEELHEKAHPDARREVPFKRVVSPDAVLSGRADFVFEDEIHECKATFSDSTFKSAKTGRPEMSHLSQLVCYMMEFGKVNGKLVYGYFVEVKPHTPGAIESPETGRWYKRQDTANIRVGIGMDDEVIVNDVATGYTVNDLTNTILQISDWMKLDVPAPRPAASGYMSACKYCPLKELCDRVDDQGLFVSEVRQEALELIESKKPAVPKPNKEK